MQDSALPRPDSASSRSAGAPVAAGTQPLTPSAEPATEPAAAPPREPAIAPPCEPATPPPRRIVEIQHIQPLGRPLTSASNPGMQLPAPPSDATLLPMVGKVLLVASITLLAMLLAVVLDVGVRNEVFKLVVVFYFALLPALIYFQFVSIRGATLWEEYTENLYRLQIEDPASLPPPSRHSRYYRIWLAAQSRALASCESKTLYQKKFESAFGPISGDHRVRVVLNSERLAPVILATVLFSAGWILVVTPYSLGWLKPHDWIWSGSWVPAFHESGVTAGHGKFPLEAIRFGFLGSYFYAVQMLVRRYFQNDLKAGAFLHATTRIVAVTLLTWAVDVAVRGTELDIGDRASLAFTIGVFPDVGWQALATLPKLVLRALVPSLRQPYPLSDLDGLNVWYESRLLEVGVEDMQNLATCNLPAVMLATRIPVERLIDWIDQSILFLHVGRPASVDQAAADPRAALRRYGIRTATDLEDALPVSPPGGAGEAERIAQLERLLTTAPTEPSVLRSVLATFQREPNLRYVRAWRGAQPTRDEALAWQDESAARAA